MLQYFPNYEGEGGVEFVPARWNERAIIAATIVARLVVEKGDLEQIAILSPHKDGDAGCAAANLAVRDMLGFNPRKIEKGDLLIVGKNNYHAQSSLDPRKEETIYNGERCVVIECGSDFLDLEFPKNSEGINPPGPPPHERLQSRTRQRNSRTCVVWICPEHAQGAGITIRLRHRHGRTRLQPARSCKGLNVYTATSRARKKVFIVGSVEDFAQAATTEETSRGTLLEILLNNGGANG